MGMFESFKRKLYDYFNVSPKTVSISDIDDDSAVNYGMWKQLMDELLQRNAEDQIKYKDYDLMDSEVPEVSAALDVTADFVIYPDNVNKTKIFKIKPKNKSSKIQDKLNEIDSSTSFKNDITSIIRDVCKYGDTVEEVLKDTKTNKIVMLKNVPMENVIVNIKKGIIQTSPEIIQIGEDNRKIAELSYDECLHFSISSDRKRFVQYGKGVSKIEKARLIYRQVRMMEEGMIIGRLSRANQNYAIMIDVGDLVGDEALQFIDKYKKRITRRKYVDPRTGRLSLQYNPLSTLEDIYVPTRAGSGANVVPLMNDRGGRQVDDIVYFQNKLIYACGVPKILIGKEEDVNSKSTADTQYIGFLRTIRRIQALVEPTIVKFYKLVLKQNYGIDDVDLIVEWPITGTIDEKLRIEIETLKAQLAATLGKDLMMFDDEWLYKNIFGMNDEEIEELTTRMDAEEDDFEAEFDANMSAAEYDDDNSDPAFDDGESGGTEDGEEKPKKKKTKDSKINQKIAQLRDKFESNEAFESFIQLHSVINNDPALRSSIGTIIQAMKLKTGDLT